MQYLKHRVLDKILKKCTSSEIDFILYIAQYQNSLGQVTGIYYKDVCLALNICKQTFYNIIDSLSKKNIILVNARCYDTEFARNYTVKKGDWSIIILDNTFLDEKDYQDGYITVARDFLQSPDFIGLKHNIKILVLKLLKVYRKDKSYKITINKLLEWVLVKNHSLWVEYVDELRKFFNIDISGTLLVIRIKQHIRYTNNLKFYFHKIRMFCKNYKIGYTDKDLDDLILLFRVYSAKYYGKLISVLCDTALRYHSLEPRLINSVLYDWKRNHK